MILEQAELIIKSGQNQAFERDFAKAKPIISSIDGFISLQLLPCIEQENKYLLLVTWRNLEDHTVGFRQSAKYQDWKALLHHYYDPFPVVEHYEL